MTYSEHELEFTFSKNGLSHKPEQTFFSERVINAWNSPSVNIVDFSTLSRFRCSISKVDITSFYLAAWNTDTV